MLTLTSEFVLGLFARIPCPLKPRLVPFRMGEQNRAHCEIVLMRDGLWARSGIKVRD